MPNIVWIDSATGKPSVGIDAGGLRQQLVTSLCENLFNKDSGFDFTTAAGDKLPVLKDASSQDAIEALRTLGRLIAICARSSIKLGAHLSPHFFKTLLRYNNDSDKKIFCNLYGYDESTFEGDIADHVKENPIVEPLRIIAKEVNSVLGPWRGNPDAFIKKVQGEEVNKANFQTSLSFGGYATRATKEQIAIVRGYFNTFMEKHPDKLGDLLELFTARRTIGDQPITVDILSRRNQGRLPYISTCAQRVEMPFYPNYEVFEDKILKTLPMLGRFGAA